SRPKRSESSAIRAIFFMIGTQLRRLSLDRYSEITILRTLCEADAQEGTLGLTQTLWKDAKYGAAQVMLQYAYLFRNPWFVAAGAPKDAHENVVWFNLRYVLPGSAPTIKY